MKYVRNLPTLFQRDSRRKALAVSKKIDCNRSMFPKVHSYVFALLSYCDYNIFSDFPIQFYGKLGVMCVVTLSLVCKSEGSHGPHPHFSVWVW